LVGPRCRDLVHVDRVPVIALLERLHAQVEVIHTGPAVGFRRVEVAVRQATDRGTGTVIRRRNLTGNAGVLCLRGQRDRQCNRTCQYRDEQCTLGFHLGPPGLVNLHHGSCDGSLELAGGADDLGAPSSPVLTGCSGSTITFPVLFFTKTGSYGLSLCWNCW